LRIGQTFELPPNPFYVTRNDLLVIEVKEYINLVSLKPYKIQEIKNILQAKDVILLGAPGTGKSSLLRLLTWEVIFELNQNKDKKFKFLRDEIFENDKNIPFFGFYINLHEDLNVHFYGTRLTEDEWQKLFNYYLSLFIISRFIRNLKDFLKRIQNESEEKVKEIKIKWRNERIPKFLTSLDTLNDIYIQIRKNLQNVEDFLIHYDNIERRKQKIRFFPGQFFTYVIEDIVKSYNIGFNRIIVILDDFSFIPKNLVKPILDIFGQRSGTIEIKLATRFTPLVDELISKLDHRDLIKIDLDYFFMNARTNLYRDMVKEITKYRLSRLFFQEIPKLEAIFPSMDELEEAQFYEKKIEIKKNDLFFDEISKKIKGIFKSEGTFFKALELGEKSNEENLKNYLRNSINGEKKKGMECDEIITHIQNLSKMYDFLKDLHNPIHRKILEVLAIRKFKKNLKLENIEKILSFFNSSSDDIEKHSHLTNICLHLLALDANESKIYGGLEQIVIISSYIVKDFLGILEKIFDGFLQERIKNGKRIFDDLVIPIEIQNRAIHKYAKKVFEDKIINLLVTGREMYEFFNGLTFNFLQPNYKTLASYENGRTGFAISSSEYTNFVKLKINNIVNEAIASSYLQIKNIRKGFSDDYRRKEHYVFYLNRILCVYFNFPLAYGGYRQISYTNLLRLLQGKKIRKKRKDDLSQFLEG